MICMLLVGDCYTTLQGLLITSTIQMLNYASNEIMSHFILVCCPPDRSYGGNLRVFRPKFFL